MSDFLQKLIDKGLVPNPWDDQSDDERLRKTIRSELTYLLADHLNKYAARSEHTEKFDTILDKDVSRVYEMLKDVNFPNENDMILEIHSAFKNLY